MEPTCLAIFLIAIFYNVSGQTDTSFANTDLSKMETQKDIYLRKSRGQKTAGFVILGIGTATFITGAIMMSHSEYLILDEEFYDGAGLMSLGILIDLGSIPFFISSAKNKKRAMSMALINEPIPKEMIAHVKQYSIPALSVRWKF